MDRDEAFFGVELAVGAGIDLGIAKAQEAGGGLTRTGTFIGKLRYCSPEHFQSGEGPKIDGRSDLYSFGIVLYELLTGHPPYYAESPAAVVSMTCAALGYFCETIDPIASGPSAPRLSAPRPR